MAIGVRHKPSRPQLDVGHPITDGLVAAYPFYAGAGSRAYDVTGGNHHSNAWTNMDSTNWDAGIPGRYVTLNGSDELIGVPKEAFDDMRSNDALTIVALVYNTDLSQDGTVAGQFFSGVDNSDDAFLLYMDTGTSDGYRFLVTDETGDTINATSTSVGAAVQDQWQVIGGRWNGETDTASVFHDGVESDSSTSNVVIGSNSVDPAIGANRGNDNNRNFPGRVALVLFWTRALTNAEMATLSDDPYLPFVTDRPELAVGSGATETTTGSVFETGSVTASGTPSGAAETTTAPAAGSVQAAGSPAGTDTATAPEAGAVAASGTPAAGVETTTAPETGAVSAAGTPTGTETATAPIAAETGAVTASGVPSGAVEVATGAETGTVDAVGTPAGAVEAAVAAEVGAVTATGTPTGTHTVVGLEEIVTGRTASALLSLERDLTTTLILEYTGETTITLEHDASTTFDLDNE